MGKEEKKFFKGKKASGSSAVCRVAFLGGGLASSPSQLAVGQLAAGARLAGEPTLCFG